MHQTNQWETYISSHTMLRMEPYQYLSDKYCCMRTLLRVSSYPNGHQILSHMHEAYPPTLESFTQTDHRSGDGNYIIRWDSLLLDENLSYEEEPVAILDREVRKLRSREIASVKVQ